MSSDMQMQCDEQQMAASNDVRVMVTFLDFIVTGTSSDIDITGMAL